MTMSQQKPTRSIERRYHSLTTDGDMFDYLVSLTESSYHGPTISRPQSKGSSCPFTIKLDCSIDHHYRQQQRQEQEDQFSVDPCLLSNEDNHLRDLLEEDFLHAFWLPSVSPERPVHNLEPSTSIISRCLYSPIESQAPLCKKRRKRRRKSLKPTILFSSLLHKTKSPLPYLPCSDLLRTPLSVLSMEADSPFLHMSAFPTPLRQDCWRNQSTRKTSLSNASPAEISKREEGHCKAILPMRT